MCCKARFRIRAPDSSASIAPPQGPAQVTPRWRRRSRRSSSALPRALPRAERCSRLDSAAKRHAARRDRAEKDIANYGYYSLLCELLCETAGELKQRRRRSVQPDTWDGTRQLSYRSIARYDAGGACRSSFCQVYDSSGAESIRCALPHTVQSVRADDQDCPPARLRGPMRPLAVALALVAAAQHTRVFVASNASQAGTGPCDVGRAAQRADPLRYLGRVHGVLG